LSKYNSVQCNPNILVLLSSEQCFSIKQQPNLQLNLHYSTSGVKERLRTIIFKFPERIGIFLLSIKFIFSIEEKIIYKFKVLKFKANSIAQKSLNCMIDKYRNN
jgi:hypothetical protein